MFSRFRRWSWTNIPESDVSLGDFQDDRITDILQTRDDLTADRESVLSGLIDLHDRLLEEGEDAAQEVRRAYLLVVRSSPSSLTEERFSEFLANHVDADDFASIQWSSPGQILNFYESLHGAHFQEALGAEKVMTYMIGLLRHGLREFEKQGQHEKMFELMRRSPVPESRMDPELLRLRDRAYLYEMQRVNRKRRLLYAYLVLQVVLIGLVFPFLFINAENGRLQQQIEETANVDVPEDLDRQYLSYSDGLYWSLITAASIGYGDITPVTRVGKMIAATLGVAGVITVGVIAGLILNWITPRQLD